MSEDVGKLSVEYVVISDAAVHRLEKLQAEMDKVEKAAEKQGKTMQLSFKQAGIAMAAFGAIAVGVLYSIIKSSSYANIWFDQLRYMVMRLADKLVELTGLGDDIDALFLIAEKFLDLWDDEGLYTALVGLKNDLIAFWNELSTTKKIIYGVIIGITAIGVATTIVGTIMLTVAIWKGAFLGLYGVLGLVNTKLGITVALKAALTWEITLVIIAVIALIAVFAWLWSKTDHGITQIAELNEIWDEFKWNVSEVGIFDALGMALDRTIEWMVTEIKWFIEVFTLAMSMVANPATIVAHAPKLKLLLAEDAARKEKRLKEINNAKMLRSREIALRRLAEREKLEADKRINITTEAERESALKRVGVMKESQGLLNSVAHNSGVGVLDNFTGQTDQIPISLEESLMLSADNAGLGVEWINDEMLALITEYKIDVRTSFNGSSGGSGSSSWNDPYDGGTVVPGHTQIGAKTPTGPGQPDRYASGGHVLRSGTAVIHQGEDIVNLKAIMSGMKMDKTGMNSNDVIINNTININSGDLRNPSETSRVANTISKKLGEELRRISTSI